jgi:hypothetical protein
MEDNIIVNFLSKYLFILKAAADGWRVIYTGGNKFEFYKNNYSKQDDIPPNDFVKRYLHIKNNDVIINTQTQNANSNT